MNFDEEDIGGYRTKGLHFEIANEGNRKMLDERYEMRTNGKETCMT